jgi:ferredoxin
LFDRSRSGVSVTTEVTIDPSICEGHGHCALEAATVFDVDDDGYGRVLLPNVPDELRDDALRGERACPVAAITVAEQ